MQAKTNIDKQKFAARLRTLLREKDATQADMARAMGIRGSSAFAWVNGTSIPRMDKLRKLAAWLGVTTDFLLGEKTKPRGSAPATPIDDMLQEMFKDDPSILDALTRGSYAKGIIRADNGRVYSLSESDRETIKNVIRLIMHKDGNDSAEL